MEPIEIFKTDVADATEAKKLVGVLLSYFPRSRINFDLYDCDKVLRVEGRDFIAAKVMMLVKEHGFNCRVLE